MIGITGDDSTPTVSEEENKYSDFRKTHTFARGAEEVKPMNEHAEHEEIRKSVYAEIKKLYVTLGGCRRSINFIIDRFLTCITPARELHDPGKLPVCVTVPRSSERGRLSCVWAVVSCLIQEYWKFERDENDDHGQTLSGYLGKLKEINEHYPEMKIVGAQNKGYWLEI